jgi:hypothetical protein
MFFRSSEVQAEVFPLASEALCREFGDGSTVTGVAQQLYEASRDIVGPVIAGFADHLLTVAEGRKVLLAARDGLAPFQTAEILQQRFEYPESDVEESSLIYAYLNRRVISGTDPNTMEEYMQQLGVDPKEDVLLGDIGMYGSFIPSMRRILPNMEVQYLISRTSEAAGYADSSENRRMRSMDAIVGNAAVHFMEDTYAGPIASPRGLVRSQDGLLVPDTISATYPEDVADMRKAALAGITAYAAGLQSRPEQPAEDAIAALDNFLIDPVNYRHLMVPHER